jgi:hypothetical protein
MPRAACRALAIFVALLLPGHALACGFCTDAVVRRRFWASSLALDLVVGLGLEAMGYVLFLVVTRRTTAFARALTHFAAAIAATVVGFFTLASGLAMAATFAVGLAVSLARSLWADRALGALVLASRLGLALGISALGLALSHPASLSTHRLVSIALIAPDSWGEAPQGWCEERLLAEPDARLEVEKRLGEVRGPLARAQDVEILRLHRLVGGDAAARGAACARLGALGAVEPAVATLHGRPGPPPGLLRALCRPAGL